VRVAALTLAAALGGATAAPVLADNALRPERIPNKARELAEQGRKHHSSGDYTSAVAAFKEAYVLAPSPSLLFNIAQAYRLAGSCDESAWMYRRFLDTHPRGPQRDLAQTHLAVVEKCGNGGLRVVVTPPTVDAATPRPEEPSVSVMRLTNNTRSHRYKRAGVYTAVGGGVALIGAALFAIDAHAASQRVEESYMRGGTWEEIAPLDARGERSAMIATVLGVGGGVAMLSAAVLYGLGKHYESSKQIAITPTRNGAAVSLSWGF
jgi:tetratricopeptide (TPR) repeat protein